MKTDIQYAKELVKTKQVKKLTENCYQVKNYSVTINKRSGRKLMLCTCKNSDKFAHSNICIHAISVIVYLAMNNSMKILDKKIEQYEKWVDIKLSLKKEVLLDDIKELRRLLWQ